VLSMELRVVPLVCTDAHTHWSANTLPHTYTLLLTITITDLCSHDFYTNSGTNDWSAKSPTDAHADINPVNPSHTHSFLAPNIPAVGSESPSGSSCQSCNDSGDSGCCSSCQPLHNRIPHVRQHR
jgi:hypothetical protein